PTHSLSTLSLHDALPISAKVAAVALSRSLRPLGLAAAASVVGYLAGTPYTVLDLPRFLQDFQTQYRFGNLAWLGQPTDPVPLQRSEEHTSELQSLAYLVC